MKSHTAYLTMNVSARMDFVNITDQVEKAVARSGVREGLCLVNSMHITSSVFINDDEPGLHEDYSGGWSSSRPTTRAPSVIITTAPARTTATPTTSARSWAGRWWWR